MEEVRDIINSMTPQARQKLANELVVSDEDFFALTDDQAQRLGIRLGEFNRLQMVKRRTTALHHQHPGTYNLLPNTIRGSGLFAITCVVMLLFIMLVFAGQMLSPFSGMRKTPSTSAPLATSAPSAASEPLTTSVPLAISAPLVLPPALSIEPLRCTTDWEGPPRNESYFWEDLGNRYTTSGCPLLQKKIRCTGERHRALVLYMIQTKDNPFDMQQEMWNLNHFIRFGVYGAHESTAMFERVDYVFTRMRPSASAVTSMQLCGEEVNIKMMWVPKCSCDLCAHGRVIDFLGGAEEVMKKYQFIFMTNAGSRGPLQHQDAPQWIDIFAMGGQTSWTEHTPPLMVGPSLKTNIPFYPTHIETHVIGISTKFLVKHMPILVSHCEGSKFDCIAQGEQNGGPAWMLNGGWLHGLSRNFTLRNLTLDAQPYQSLSHKYGIGEPLRQHYDVCAAIFTKHGGSFMREPMLDKRTAARTAQLTMHQSPQRRLGGGDTFRKLLTGGECDFVEL